MARALTTFSVQWRRNAAIAILAALAAAFAVAVYTTAVHADGYFTGWLLFSLVLFLSCYGLRKRVTTLPIGTASTWLQWHAYAGFVTIFVFGLHIGWRVPNGIFEIALAVVFLTVAITGVAGLMLSRYLPRRLTRRGEEVIYERIPAFMTQLREEAEKVVLEAVTETGSTVLHDFYVEKLAEFFAAPRNRLAHLVASNRSLFHLLHELGSLERYLGPDGKEYLTRLRDLTVRKDDLDFHCALLGALKIWVFVHVPVTSALLIGIVLHLIVVYAFTGGL